ncbi:cationic peroxidase 1-like [Setaria viridis]|uniref:cationic peroxidase 1-like n=1 Tax=Setaria viridis TaxID=4556 RepID=UPI003B3B608B
MNTFHPDWYSPNKKTPSVGRLQGCVGSSSRSWRGEWVSKRGTENVAAIAARRPRFRELGASHGGAGDGMLTISTSAWRANLGCQPGKEGLTTASLDAANSDIPKPTFDLSDLIKSFSNKGLTAIGMIALSGGHTIGQARCVNFRNRIYSETNIDTSLATSLKSNCPNKTGDNNISPLDASTPYAFDNFYYKNLLNKKGVLPAIVQWRLSRLPDYHLLLKHGKILHRFQCSDGKDGQH